jgi:hypothetical protein
MLRRFLLANSCNFVLKNNLILPLGNYLVKHNFLPQEHVITLDNNIYTSFEKYKRHLELSSKLLNVGVCILPTEHTIFKKSSFFKVFFMIVCRAFEKINKIVRVIKRNPSVEITHFGIHVIIMIFQDFSRLFGKP